VPEEAKMEKRMGSIVAMGRDADGETVYEAEFHDGTRAKVRAPEWVEQPLERGQVLEVPGKPQT
jgi:hypothetical protein